MNKCYKLDCQCDCKLEHKKCRQTACNWRVERWLESDNNKAKEQLNQLLRENAENYYESLLDEHSDTVKAIPVSKLDQLFNIKDQN